MKDTNIPSEVWRYYLLINRPEISDTLFTWEDFQAKLNTELLNNLGNFINRVLSFIAKPLGRGYGSTIPDAPGAESDPLTKKLAEKVGNYVEQYVQAMEKVKLKQGLKIGMSISGEGNAYLQMSQFWDLYKKDQASCSIVTKTSVGLVYLLAWILQPFMPSFTTKVLNQLNLPEAEFSLSDESGDLERAKRPWELLPAGHRIGMPSPLFAELRNEVVILFREKFGGKQARRDVKAEGEGEGEGEAKRIAEQLKKATVSTRPSD